jgi:RNA polymerase sigma factor (sigma-70 family)
MVRQTTLARPFLENESPLTTRPRSRPACSQTARGRALFEDHLDMIQEKLRRVNQHSGLPESEEFASWALLKLLEDDCRILASWQGRSSFSTYLTVVLVNLMRDYRSHVWGKWRPSAVARRKGAEAVLLERLWLRDGLPLEQSIDRIRTEHGVSLSRSELERIAAELPHRCERRQVGEEELQHIPIDGRVEERVEHRERNRITALVRGTLGSMLRELSAEDRLLLQLHYRDGLSMASISPILGRTPRELYSLRDRCLKKLRQALERVGLDAERLSAENGWSPWEFQLDDKGLWT